jgi:hypothetical protein
MRKLTLLAILAVTAAQARGQSTPPPAEPAAQAQPPGPQVMYACPGGSDFAAAFSKEGDLATISVPGQPEVELPRQPSGSGFAFGDSYYELRGRGREATLTAGGRSMRCHAIGRPGEPPRTYQGGGLTITLFPDGIFRLRDRSGATETVDVGQWGQEVDGGVRMVLRGGTVARRVFREDNGDKLVAENGSLLERAATADPIDDRFRLTGLYRDTQTGGLFTECLTGRTFEVAPGGAEPDLERAWTEATPARSAPSSSSASSATARARLWRRAARRCAKPNGGSPRSTASGRSTKTGDSGRGCGSTTTASSVARPAAIRWPAATSSTPMGCASSRQPRR